MNKKLSDEQVAAMAELRQRGWTWAALAKANRVTAECARRAVGKFLAAGAPAPAPTPEDAPAGDLSPAESDAVIAEAEAALEDETTDEGMLDALIRDLRKMQRDAKTDAQRLTVMRLLTGVVGQRAKLRPEAPPDPNANPLVRLSAERCIAKLHELLDRV